MTQAAYLPCRVGRLSKANQGQDDTHNTDYTAILEHSVAAVAVSQNTGWDGRQCLEGALNTLGVACVLIVSTQLEEIRACAWFALTRQLWTPHVEWQKTRFPCDKPYTGLDILMNM